jgi:RNA polymerase sigma-70 factor (ECF subfamily)
MNALLAARGPDVPAAAEPLDLEWFGAFYEEHANFVRRLVGRLDGQRSERDDLVQEVFLVAHRKWPQLVGSPRVDPRNWLYGVVVRVLRRERRRRKLRAFLFLERFQGGRTHELTDEHTPATLLERHETRVMVHRLLDSISENKRTVFVLFEIERLSGQQIADILRVPIQTVWNRLFHARKAFLKLLTREKIRERREVGEE